MNNDGNKQTCLLFRKKKNSDSVSLQGLHQITGERGKKQIMIAMLWLSRKLTETVAAWSCIYCFSPGAEKSVDFMWTPKRIGL